MAALAEVEGVTHESLGCSTTGLFTKFS
jgi:hypothetical protein